jgi:hypothetical protein
LQFQGFGPSPRTLLDKEEQSRNIGFRRKELYVMIAILGTLPFLATIWLLVVLGAAVLEESGAKIAAALKGESARQSFGGAARVTLRTRSRIERPVSAPVEWRAAA